MMPAWHQLVSMSGHVEESETARKLQLYATSIYQVHSFVCQLDYKAAHAERNYTPSPAQTTTIRRLHNFVQYVTTKWREGRFSSLLPWLIPITNQTYFGVKDSLRVGNNNMVKVASYTIRYILKSRSTH